MNFSFLGDDGFRLGPKKYGPSNTTLVWLVRLQIQFTMSMPQANSLGVSATLMDIRYKPHAPILRLISLKNSRKKSPFSNGISLDLIDKGILNICMISTPEIIFKRHFLVQCIDLQYHSCDNLSDCKCLLTTTILHPAQNKVPSDSASSNSKYPRDPALTRSCQLFRSVELQPSFIGEFLGIQQS